MADGGRRAGSGAPTRVVIAEDEAIIRLDLKEILESAGYVVVGETARGDEAVDLVEAHRPDLVILDVKMPGMDGLRAAREITSRHRVAVLVLTAFSQRNLIEDARGARARRRRRGQDRHPPAGGRGEGALDGAPRHERGRRVLLHPEDGDAVAHPDAGGRPAGGRRGALALRVRDPVPRTSPPTSRRAASVPGAAGEQP